MTCIASPCSTTPATYSLGTHTYYATAADTNNNVVADPPTGTKSFIVSTTTASGLPALPAGQTWQMTFSDEFNGPNLDQTKWNPGWSDLPWCPGCAAWTANSALKRMSFVDGKIQMYPTLTPGTTPGEPGFYKTSATTYNKFEQKYGYFETRFKTTAGNGLWSGFWLLPHSLSSFTPDHREIDIFENLGYQPNKIYMSLHDGTFIGEYQQPYTTSPDFSQEYHILGLQWVENSGTLIWYVDGIERARSALTDVSSRWNEPAYTLLDTSCMYVNWGPSCDSTTPNPAYHYVDYVRAYKVVSSGSQKQIYPFIPLYQIEPELPDNDLIAFLYAVSI